MMKFIHRIGIIALFILLFTVSVCQAATGEENVRVRIRAPRLYNEKASLEGYEGITVYQMNGNLNKMFTLNESKVSVFLDSYNPFHVVLDDVYSSYDEACDEAKKLENNFDEDFYPCLSSSGFKVYGGCCADNNGAEELLSELESSGYSGKTVKTNMENIIIYDESDNAVFMYSNDMSIYFSSYNGGESCEMIKIDGKPYRGTIGFKISQDAKLISINYVGLESYLYGVVPNEISASWGVEALKAQAVAARTYAIYSLRPGSSSGYDLEDNQNSQVYMGVVSEKESTNNAVDKTRGEMIYYDGRPIQALYHSTSGGSTENSENVWSEKLPYAVGVDDEYSNRSDSPYSEWQKSYTKEEIIKKLNDGGNPVSQLYGIEIAEVSKNNRVIKCIFLTDIGEIPYYKENARLMLGLMSSWFTLENSSGSFVSGSRFYFTNENTFEDEVNNEKTEKDKLNAGEINGKYGITDKGINEINQKEISAISSGGVSILGTRDTGTVASRYNFKGRGWGHGVGMSQYGAKQMANEGFTYEEILEHYYTGVTIK